MKSNDIKDSKICPEVLSQVQRPEHKFFLTYFIYTTRYENAEKTTFVVFSWVFFSVILPLMCICVATGIQVVLNTNLMRTSRSLIASSSIIIRLGGTLTGFQIP